MRARQFRRWIREGTLASFMVGVGLGLGLLGTFVTAAVAGVDPTMLEALKRLRGIDLEANPGVKKAVLSILERVRGTDAFVEIVRDFRVPGQEAGLLEAVGEATAEATAPEAIRLLIQAEGTNLLSTEIQRTTPERRLRVLRALSAVVDARAAPLLGEVVTNTAHAAAERATALRGLAGTEEGARMLLGWGRDGVLDEAMSTSARLVLAQCRWDGVRREAARVFPAPRTSDGQELPPISELIGMSGDAARGADVFRSEEAACSKCHRMGDTGTDFGPALTLIGAKLGKQALYESILDPSAGISFGYEGWQVTLRNGDEVFGLVASETAEELAIRQQGGSVVRLSKSDIVVRERQKLSVMPAGLGQLLTRQQLVDLVEYLAASR